MTSSTPAAATLPRPPVDPTRDAPRSPTGGRRRVLLGALLLATAGLYLWNLSASGWGNAFYAAASQAGGVSWKAWFFGSSDAANLITVDKTPAALWVSGLSVRIFGLSSWSVLAPQALMGVASVALLYASVRRTAGTAAGLLAGAVLALTPAAVLMFRFDNPDALLTLLLVGAAYATVRAVEKGHTGWLLLAATLVGFGFLTKMLQAFLVLPAFALVWLLVAPVGIGRRLRDLALATVALVVSGGWWLLVVELWPASDRPYIGGSQTNSVLELVLGYNGFGRLTGDEVGSVGGGGGGVAAAGTTGSWGETGLGRLFDAEFGGQASWLLPAALLLTVVLLWWTRRAPRTDPGRAATIVWGGWLLVTWLTFSLMAGIFHPYYLVALAPPIGALVGIGATVLWRDRAGITARVTMAVLVGGTAGWALVLLRRTPQWQPWLAWTVLAVGVVATLGLLGVHRAPRVLAIGVATAAVAAGLAAPAGYSVATAATAHTGSIPSAGPAVAGRRGPGGGGPGGGAFRGQPPAGVTAGTTGGAAAGTAGGPAGAPPAGQAGGGFGGGRGGMGSLLSSPTPGAAVVTALRQDAAGYTWAAAAVGSNSAAGYQLATRLPVMALGGYNGTDPAPTLAEFQQLVAQHRVHWFVGGTGPGGTSSGGSNDAQQIAQWVQATFTATTVDGTTLYDLSPAS